MLIFFIIFESLQLALRSSQLLMYMINDILDLTQITNGKLRLNIINFNVADCIKDLSKLIKFQAKRKGLQFEFHNKLDPKRQMINSDPNRLKQIILNLLGNALKFTEKGAVTIVLEKALQGEVTNSVKDSGCGIKKEDIPRLFNLFGKLESKESLKVNQAGIGLGLAISQSLTKLLNMNRPGAEITVQSEFGKGSVFAFDLYDMKGKIAEDNSDEEKSNE